jgi:hypothetical protein
VLGRGRNRTASFLAAPHPRHIGLGLLTPTPARGRAEAELAVAKRGAELDAAAKPQRRLICNGLRQSRPTRQDSLHRRSIMAICSVARQPLAEGYGGALQGCGWTRKRKGEGEHWTSIFRPRGGKRPIPGFTEIRSANAANASRHGSGTRHTGA